jgi:hypothetical protein
MSGKIILWIAIALFTVAFDFGLLSAINAIGTFRATSVVAEGTAVAFFALCFALIAAYLLATHKPKVTVKEVKD